MASPAMTPPPSMGQDSGGAPPPDPSQNASPVSAAPAPPQPSPQVAQGTRMLISIVGQLRELAKAFPGAAPAVQEINDKMRDVAKAIMAHGTPGEPSAPPTGA